MKTIKVTIEEAKQIIENFANENPHRKTELAYIEFNLGAYYRFNIGDITYYL